MGQVFAPVVALAFLTPITFSLLKSNRKKKLHDLREDIRAIQGLSRPEFKQKVGEAYEQAGYLILERNPFTSDQTVDLVMRKSANLYLLQSRYWLNRKIGLREVKKLYSIMHRKQASGIFLLTTGIFTREARRFAAGKPINLVDGIELVALFDSTKKNDPGSAVSH
ncbi:MAG: restriction endonuclease [Deltaproteobacteria bacterium]|nr:restriction endonuclease [Deltaproteobacteria bacterium]